MLLLGALPSKWDHVAAIYLQGKTTHTDINYTEVRNAIIAEFNQTGVHPGQQQHVHKISAIKRKGQNDPSFSQQRSHTNAPKARDEGQASSNKKKPKKSKGKGKQAHFVEHEPAPTPFSLAASAVRPMITLQPSRASPSTMTVASINPNRVTYLTVATPKTAQQYTGAPRKVGPNTLQKERGLLKRMEVTPTIQNLKTMSLEDHLEYPPPPTMAPEAISLADQIYESNRVSHSTQESGPSISQFNAMIPPPVPHMPTASKRKMAKKPKKVVVTSAGLPPVDMSIRRRDSTPRIVEVPDDGDEVLDWGSSDDSDEVLDWGSSDEITEITRKPGVIRVDNDYSDGDDRDGTGGIFDDHYDPRQVTFSLACIFEIYPQNDAPKLAKIGEVSLDLIAEDITYSLFGNRAVIYDRIEGIIIAWDFVANAATRWSISSRSCFEDEVYSFVSGILVRATHYLLVSKRSSKPQKRPL